jgi:CRISPR/Cas system endoribonuclease Cas6 (RAMP superfamily)
VMAGFSIFITTGFAAKLLYHYFVSKRSLENVEAACIDYNADKLHEIEQIIQQKPKSQMSTTIIDKELAGFSPDEKIDEVTLAELRSSLNQNTKTEPHSSHNMDDLAKLNEQTIETILRHAEEPTRASNDEQIIDDEGDGKTSHGPLK